MKSTPIAGNDPYSLSNTEQPHPNRNAAPSSTQPPLRASHSPASITRQGQGIAHQLQSEHAASRPVSPTMSLAELNQALDLGKQQAIAHLDACMPQAFAGMPMRMTTADLQRYHAQHLAQAEQAFDLTRLSAQAERLDASAPDDENHATLNLQSAYDEISEHLTALYKEAGWYMDLKKGAVKWEAQSPMVWIRHCDFENLNALPGPSHEGEHGTVSPYESQGQRFAVKTAKSRNSSSDVLTIEFEGYKRVLDKAGLHRNMMVPIGLGKVDRKRRLLLGHVDGPNGQVRFAELRQCRQRGLLSERQFQSVFKYFMRRGLSVVGHLAEAGIVGGDFKPDNIVFDAEHEPIFGDLGMWSESGAPAEGKTPIYGAPEADPDDERGVTASADLFSLCATTVAAMHGEQGLYVVEEGHTKLVWPNLVYNHSPSQTPSVRHPASEDTPRGQFFSVAMKLDPDQRISLAAARQHPYLNTTDTGAPEMSDDDVKAMMSDALEQLHQQLQQEQQQAA
ncbi:hypothetical protein F506_09560 [Herbaspirillum hiltneri N3]|uniref:Protein kinase domain-containing protein n=1 Tax=Herbaspirillum hiltneri N3 TaxID=1262470 RepID=A0ABN4HVQ0_9BURK|nr:serine/threonine-protein kinase [Herbaspirillum hiltneri]AKZ62891.1 hypothetical protein F506_09560 [Herbaspirillum hiltneri N3]